MPEPIEAALFPFEDVLPDLEFVPLAGRRALDLAGVRLTLEGWRSLSVADRKGLALAGAPDDVDVEQVLSITRRAMPPPTRIAPAADPDPLEPPEPLSRALGADRPLESKRWAELRSLDRYALVHGYRRSIAKGTKTQLERTFDAIVGGPVSSSSRLEKPSGGYSSIAPPSSGSLASRPTNPIEGPATSVQEPPTRVGAASSTPRRGTAVSAKPVAISGTSVTLTGVPATSPNPVVRATGEPSPRVSPTGSPSTLGSHVDGRGEVHMVDVGGKPISVRRAVARGFVRMKPSTAAMVESGVAPKGEVLATARVAGILAAKRTPELIPLCHAVALTRLGVELELDAATGRVRVEAVAEAVDRTGVEMEAMVAVSIACLTLYDMLKGLDRDIEIERVHLVEKTGGKTGRWVRGASA